MCGTCGCGQPDPISYKKPGEEKGQEHLHHHEHEHSHNGHIHSHSHPHTHRHDYPHSHDHHEGGSDHAHHHHDHDHHHDHEHDHSHGREINLEVDILRRNDLLAERNRGFFEARDIVALNLVSSPGSGKTTLLERTIREYAGKRGLFVIEGDQQTMLDADRINQAGAPVLQVNTGNGCHLDATMVNTAVKKLEIKDNAILFIENVGNLVCPALFDLGETSRVVIASVTEGEDKPLKYPNMFQSAQLCIINKTDLLPYVDFNVQKFTEYALRVNHHLVFIELSAKTGDGFPAWMKWLEKI